MDTQEDPQVRCLRKELKSIQSEIDQLEERLQNEEKLIHECHKEKHHLQGEKVRAFKEARTLKGKRFFMDLEIMQSNFKADRDVRYNRRSKKKHINALKDFPSQY